MRSVGGGNRTQIVRKTVQIIPNNRNSTEQREIKSLIPTNCFFDALICKQGVAGSIPATSTILYHLQRVFQLVSSTVAGTVAGRCRNQCWQVLARMTWRLYPDTCAFISEMFYDSRSIKQPKADGGAEREGRTV